MVLELQSSVPRADPDAAPLTSLRRGPFSITAFSTGAACVFVMNLNGGFAVITATSLHYDFWRNAIRVENDPALLQLARLSPRLF